MWVVVHINDLIEASRRQGIARAGWRSGPGE